MAEATHNQHEIKPHILYVDDQQENLDGFRYTFRKDYFISTALTAVEGLKILDEQEVGVVISDQRMPDVTGTEFLGKVAQLYPDPIRIILTAYADFDAVVEAVNKGQVYRFLTKPWNKEDLKGTIENAMETYRLKQENNRLVKGLTAANQDLQEINRQLLEEIEKRKTIEQELKLHKDHLELLVNERTEELAIINEELSATNEELTEVNEILTQEINERKKIQQYLRESEDKFRGFIEQSADAILMVDEHGTILEANNGAAELFDIPSGEIKKLNLLDIPSRFLPEKYRSQGAMTEIQESINKLFAGKNAGYVKALDGYVETSKGGRKFIQSSLFYVKSDIRNYLGYVARDLSEKKKAEEELESYRNKLEELVEKRTKELLKSEQRIETLSDNLPGGAIFRGYTGPDEISNIVYASKGMEEIAGFSNEILKSDINSLFDRVVPEDICLLNNSREAAKIGLQSLDIIVRYMRNKDDLRWLQIRSMYTRTDDVYWWDGYIVDITERKRSEALIQESENIVQKIQDVISQVTGEQMLDTILVKIEETLHTHLVFIAELDPSDSSKLRTISVCQNGKIHENFSYSIQGTPSEMVLQSGIKAYPRKVYEVFPNDEVLREHTIEGYVSIPLVNTPGKLLGVIVAASQEEIRDTDMAIRLMQIFSVRIASELERIKQEKELKEREQRFRTLFEFSPNMMLIIRMDAAIMDVNPAFYHFTKYRKENIIGQLASELPLKDEKQREEIRAEFNEKGKITDKEVVFYDLDGNIKHVILSVVPVTIGGENCFLASAIDISDRRLVEQKLESSEVRFRSILQNLTDILWILAPDTTILFETPSAAKTMGYPEGALLGTKGIELVHPDDVNEVITGITEVVKKINLNTPTQFRAKTQAGKWIYLEAIGKNMLDHPHIGGIILSARNVTERIMQDKALRESEEKFRNIFNSSTDAILISSMDQSIIEVNKVLMQRSGFTREELIGKKTTEFFPSAVWDKFNERYGMQEKTDFSPVIELDYTNRYGESIPIEINSHIIDYAGSKALLSIIRDLTERKRMEKVLIDTIIHTEEKERERFAADLHDEIGPLLSGMKMYLASLTEFTDTSKRAFVVDQLQSLTKEAIITIREISNDLSPHLLTNYGLLAAVNATIESKKQLITIRLQQNIGSKRMNSNIEIINYRIIKELINNTLKHASASQINLNLNYRNQKLQLKYTDDGVGFDYDEKLQSANKGLGLMNIASRAKSINGVYQFITSRGKGFSFELTVNIK